MEICAADEWIHTAKDSRDTSNIQTWLQEDSLVSWGPCLPDMFIPSMVLEEKGYSLTDGIVERRIVENLFDKITEKLRTDLRSLITEDGDWSGFVKAAGFSSEEGAALRDALKEHLEQEPTDENDRPQKKQQNAQFFKVFPDLKKKLESNIKELQKLAKKLDQVHKDCTISNVVSTCASIASGVLALLGLVLSPITAGASLVASSAVLGGTATVSSLTTTVVEESMRLSYEYEASGLIGASMDVLDEIVKIMPKITDKLCSTLEDLAETFKTLKGQIEKIRSARSISRPGAQARNVTSTGRSSGQVVRQMVRGGFTIFSLGWDVYNLVNQSKDLYGGAKTVSGGALRDLAHMLEENLQKFEQKYNDLKSDPTQ
ncbi:apolipoprotein L3-like [Mus pahari]|uniref:apolipoprotein L3-like n=1 Tax=Mus pahari TaxID=10093 RepID=UPI0011149A09|nr:apolipoprotein L3-like [Mus pahari]